MIWSQYPTISNTATINAQAATATTAAEVATGTSNKAVVGSCQNTTGFTPHMG